MLDYAKLEAGALELDPVRFSPTEMVAEAVDLISGQADAKGLALTTHIAPDVPAEVVGD